MRMKKYVKLVNWKRLKVKARMAKPIAAGNTSKNQVKYSFGLIPERISPMKNNGIKICGCFIRIGLFFSLKIMRLSMKKQFLKVKFPYM